MKNRFQIKQLALGTFAMLVVSSVLFFGSYVIVLTMFKEPLVLEIERQMIGKVKKS